MALKRAFYAIPAVHAQAGPMLEDDPAEWFVYAMCDGVTDLSAPAFLSVHRSALRRLLARRVVRRCPKGFQGPEPDIDGVLFSITGRCNMRCRHCYMGAPEEQNELPLDSMQRIGRHAGFAHRRRTADARGLGGTDGFDIGARYGYHRHIHQFWLGFPVYRVYVPGASEVFLHYPLSRAEFAAWVRLRRVSKVVYDLPGASRESLETLADAMLDLKGDRLPVYRAPLERLADRSTPEAGAHEGAFEALLLGSIGRYGQAARAMNTFLATDAANRTPRRLYEAYRDYWRALESGQDEASALANCEKAYGANLAARCRAAHSTPNGLFDPQIWPQCPNCNTCGLASRCLRNAVVQTWNSLREK